MYKISRRDDTLRDSIANLFRRKEKTQTFWALKNISFDVNKEEIIGVIGRNGAGKSTLLKILSRITYPTTGEIRIKGRVASLLEVGTGFHPELTGRENIYLNGSILGMKKKEIESKFDEIVSFSGIEQFLDTPVKRYSSGMFVRLAFSVAAHLESEILLVDEVLAVGDAQFQKKCLGKMKEASEIGRTILFVSHNMAAITNLCQKVMLIDNGEIKEINEPDKAITNYLESFKESEHLPLAERTDRNFSGNIRLTDIRILDTNAQKELETVVSGQNILIEVSYETINKTDITRLHNFNIGLAFFTSLGQFVFVLNSKLANKAFESLPPKGKVYCNVPRFPLVFGTFNIKATLVVNEIPMDQVEHAKRIEVIDGDFFGTGITQSWKRQGVYIPHSWHESLENLC
jgi:lipopolysaccharide transport system ATP-binding protein